MNHTIYLLRDDIRVNGLDGSPVEAGAGPVDKSCRSLRLTAAANSAVSFQIIVEPAGGVLTRLEAEAGAPVRDDGATPPGAAIELYTEWFHRVGDRLVPDLLLPLTGDFPAFSIPLDKAYHAGQKAGALWADLWFPADTKPGAYRSKLRLVADGEEVLLEVACQVVDACVPAKNIITADLNNYADSLSQAFDSLRDAPDRYRDGSYLAVERAFYRMAREHRCLYHNLPYRHSGAMPEGFAPKLAGEGKNIRVESWEDYDRQFGPYFDGSAFRGCRNGEHPVEFAYLPFHLGWPADYTKWGRKGYRTEYRRILAEFTRHLEEKGWNSTVFEILLNHKKDYRFFPYTVDEIWYEHDQDVVDTYYDIIRDVFDTAAANIVFRMDSSNHYGNHFDHRFSDYCRMWVAGFAMFNWFPESVKVMNDKGNILWIYGSVLQGLEEPLSSVYLWPIQTLMTGATGFTVWNTTGFGDDPLRCPADRGGMALFYPGSYFGVEAPLPSIRLKVLRNATQMADLMASLQATDRNRPARDRVNEAFGFADDSRWFMPKPPFVDTPPRYWDFDKEVGDYALPQLYRDRPPELFTRLSDSLLNLIGGVGGEEEDGPRFRFQ